MNNLLIDFYSSILSVPEQEWDALWPNNYPFTRHAFLSSLESSGCTRALSGWQPHHCVVRRSHQIIACIPLFIKTHSYGEYVFDWSWANAYHDHGLAYYPKLINAIPFTPATGPRWAIASQLSEDEQLELIDMLQQALFAQTRIKQCSSLHLLFVDSPLLLKLDHTERWLHRRDCQYHWFNQGYRNFTDFVQQFNSRKRKNLLKERKKIKEQNIVLEMTLGKDLAPLDWQHFYSLYRLTYLKRSGHQGYLNADFFQKMGNALQDNIVMARAFSNGQWVAAALYFFDEQTLYGRYWGCTEEFNALHFECCYYQGIEFAIARNLQRFDPGAQGEHKVARGFQPVYTESLHYIEHPGFAAAIGDFVQREKQHINQHCSDLCEHLPYKAEHQLLPASILIAPN